MKLIGDRPMTNAERQARWRERHAAKLARKAARSGRPTPFTTDEFAKLFFQPGELPLLGTRNE
jgi:hypothetical protein